MSQKPKEIRLEVRVRNNLILSRMEEMGIASVAELARQIGTPTLQGHIGELVSMKIPARNQSGEWRPSVLRIANFLRCLPEDLFTEEQQQNALGKNKAVLEVSLDEVRHVLANRSAGHTPEALLRADEMSALIGKALSSLSPREEKILRLRFGFDGKEHTLEEVGQILNVTRDRIRQIEAHAMRKLKHPVRVRAMLGLEKGDDWWKEPLIDQDVLDALH